MKYRCAFCKKAFCPQYKKQIFCSSTCSNRYNLNNRKAVVVPLKYSAELAELFGILLGDGSVTKYYTKVYLNLIADKGYERSIVHLTKALFPGIKTCIMERPERGTREIQISSVEISDYFRSIGFDPRARSIPSWIQKSSRFKKATIRGLFDTEGSIGLKYFKGKNGTYVYRQLTFTNNNQHILRFVEESLGGFGFSPTKNSKKNIYISNKKDIKRYFHIIGTSNPKLEKKMEIE